MNDRPNKSRALGRGLSALMADLGEPDTVTDMTTQAPRPAERTLPIERIVPNPHQPRKTFSEEALLELAASIRTKGVLQPLIVREAPESEGLYEIVAGERRWRAAQLAQAHELPVIIRDLSDGEVLEIAIIENIQRADLNAVEEATGYRQLMDRFGHTQEQLATALGKSRSHIANLLRLLTLPDDVLAHLREGRLTAGHARALVTSPNPSALAQQVMRRGMSVRDAERLAKNPGHRTEAERDADGTPRSEPKDADTRAMEQTLSATLRMGVSIQHRDISGAGEITIRYRNLDQLDTLCRLLSAYDPEASLLN